MTKATKEQIAQAIIDKIISNSEQGSGYNADTDRKKALPKYSKGYIESDAFTAFGKSAGSINMTLTGDLLGQIDVLSSKGDELKIGWENPTENAKAHGNITGQNGLWEKKRDFFGLTATEIAEIIKEYG